MATAWTKRIEIGLLEALRLEAGSLAPLLQASVEENMHQSTLPIGASNATEKLHKASGALSRALVRGKRGNIFKVDIKPTGSTVEIGIDPVEIPYAAIHEFGGQIPITARMRRFFWAKYYETGADLYKGLALTKKSFIRMPKRPYFAPGVEDFERSDALRAWGRLVVKRIKEAVE